MQIGAKSPRGLLASLPMRSAWTCGAKFANEGFVGVGTNGGGLSGENPFLVTFRNPGFKAILNARGSKPIQSHEAQAPGRETLWSTEFNST